ncbi:hypothetical protein ACFFMN_30925 [Planobispora siamensis]|uniref:SH3 domain-containing protein n=1 Tax=Planobispora siamensis TaxID=936338 RepID=A0A8J3SAZ0_9ACTN|nr:hypothetical protein [Planobispora siamensis]GIH91391.1 hypothetical protein Psi01_20210 [Planobispora siamensis]
MRLKRLLVALLTAALAAVGTVVAGVALASPARAADLNCVYLVKRTAAVKADPAKKAETTDRIRRGDRTLGSCRKYGKEKNWHKVVGTRKLKKGYTRQRNLKRLGTTKQFGL